MKVRGLHFSWIKTQSTREPRAWTPLRIKLAKKSVEKQFAAIPLFPELVVDQTVEDRMQRMDSRSDSCSARIRNSQAFMWREARQRLRALDSNFLTRFHAHWNASHYPKTGVHLLSAITYLQRKEAA